MAGHKTKDEIKEEKARVQEVFAPAGRTKVAAERDDGRETGGDEGPDAPAGSGSAADGLSGSAASREQDDLNRD